MSISRKNIRDSIKAHLGVKWLLDRDIRDPQLNDYISDEIEELIGDIGAFEKDYTTTATANQAYITLPDDVMQVRNVYYDYKDNSDWGVQLTEITPSDLSGYIPGVSEHYYTEEDRGTPTSYFLLGRNVVGEKKLYFDKLPDAVTVRIIYWKWPESITNDTDALELTKLWGKAIKHKVLMNLLATDPKRTMDYGNQLRAYEKVMAVINERSQRSFIKAQARFHDVG